MSLSIQVGDEKRNLDKVILERGNGSFNLLDASESLFASVKYVLKIVDNYEPDDYLIYLFRHNNIAENHIFQVYEKNLGDRIGWIFPIQSLMSSDHSYAGDEHFLKYAYVAYCKLLKRDGDLPTYTPILNADAAYTLEDFYGKNRVVLVLSKNLLTRIDPFNVISYLPSLYKKGYHYLTLSNYFIEDSIGQRDIYFEETRKRITICRTSQYLEDNSYLSFLFIDLLPYEKHCLVRFYFLYQVIELLIERILNKGLKSFFSEIEGMINTQATILKDKVHDINSLLSERNRIQRLFGDYVVNIDYVKLRDECNRLLSLASIDTQEEAAKSLYTARNLLVHNYRTLPQNCASYIEDLNDSLETFIIDLLMNYTE
jgi:hypothetical protein